MYLYCICYIALVILAGLTVFRHRWNGTQILFSPFNVDRTLSLRGILVLLIVLHHLSGVTSFPGLSPSFRMLVSQFTFFGGGAVSMFFFISGYGLMASLHKKGKIYLDSFYKKRFLKLLPPLLIATCIFICIRMCFEHLSAWNICYEMTLGNPPLPNSWYMYALFILYIFFHAVFSICGVQGRKALNWMWIGSFAYIACILLLGWGYWWYTSVLSFNIGIEYACMSQGVQSFVRKKLISFFVGSILFLLVFIFIYLRFVSDGMKIASLIALNVTLPIVMVWVIQVLGIVNLTSLKFLGGISYELYLVHGIFIYLSKNYYSYGGTLIIVCYTLSIVTAFMLNRGSKYIKQNYKSNMISIVIPLYNKAHTIVHTLNAVFKQEYQDFEVIIVDDGSTDNGVGIIQQHFHDNRIRIFHQENQGVSVARNRGVEEARCEYVALLDGDDEWHPDYLKIMTKHIQNNPRCGLFLCAFIAQGASRSIYCIPKGFENYQGEINLFHNVSLFGQTSGTVLKKSVFNRTHRYIPHMIYHEDYLLIQAVALIAPVFYCGIPLNKYRGDVPGQTTQNPNTPQAEESKLMYYNIGMEDSLRVSEKGNESLNIYLRYFLFHDFKRRLSLKDNEALLRFIQRLSFDVKKLFYPFELSLIAHYPRVAILYINLTKVRWRLRRYPTWGDKCDLNKINPQYLNW